MAIGLNDSVHAYHVRVMSMWVHSFFWRAVDYIFSLADTTGSCMGRSLHTAEAKRSTSFSFVFHMHFLSIRLEKRSEVCFEVDRLLLRNFCVRVSFAFFFLRQSGCIGVLLCVPECSSFV